MPKPIQKRSKKVNKNKVHKISNRTIHASKPIRHQGARPQYCLTHTFFELEKDDPEAYVLHVYPPRPHFDRDTNPILTPLPATERGIHSMGNRATSVTIFKPCKNAMQNEKNDNWMWKVREDRGRGEVVNQYSNGDDYFADLQYYPSFKTKEEAVAWAQLEGIQYTVEEEPIRKYDLRSYADNFKWKGPAAV